MSAWSGGGLVLGQHESIGPAGNRRTGRERANGSCQAEQFATSSNSAQSNPVYQTALYYCPSQSQTCSSNNGNLLSATLGALGGVAQSYTYDAVNRLTAASETSSWSQTYDHDRFANHWVTSGYNSSSAFVPTSQSNFNASNNRLVLNNSDQDTAGNLTAIGGYRFKYDAEGHQTVAYQTSGSTITGYVYDGDGRRVAKLSCPYNTDGVCTPETSDATVSATFAYDAQGRLMAEYGESATAAGTQYFSVDHLGSTRAVTDSAGLVVKRMDYVPYGELLVTSNRTTALGYESSEDANSPRQRFTGKERDAETGLDYFGARYFSAAQGRFTSPDPLGTILADVTNPQTWNQYAYVLNNAMRFIDPTGYGHCQPASGAKAGQDAGSPEACVNAGGTWVPDAGDPQTIQNDSGETATIATPSTTMNVTPEDDNTHWWLVHLVIGGRDARSGRRGVSGASQKTSAANDAMQAKSTKCKIKVGVGIGLDVAGATAGLVPGAGAALVTTQVSLGLASAAYSAYNGNVGFTISNATGAKLSAVRAVAVETETVGW